MLEEAKPFFDALHPFFQELNPILSYANYHQATIAGFLANGGPDLAGTWGDRRARPDPGRADRRALVRAGERTTSPVWERGNAYLAPNGLARGLSLGTIESLTCDARRAASSRSRTTSGAEAIMPACFEAPPSLYDGKLFNFLRKGKAPIVDAPNGSEGTKSDGSRRALALSLRRIRRA